MQRLRWQLICYDNSILKYCSHCRKKVRFINSNKIRRNANGKNIYEFIIYKCPKDHTWNKKVPPKSKKVNEVEPVAMNNKSLIDEIDWFADGVEEKIEIFLEIVVGKWRLDKLLAAQLKGMSRSAVSAMIDRGQILLNGNTTKGKSFLKTGDTILLCKNQ